LLSHYQWSRRSNDAARERCRGFARGDPAGENLRVSSYEQSGWQDFGVAAAGASAALAGLVFVAVSINLHRILSYPWLPDRVGETVTLLVAVLVESLLLLAPGQSRVALGAEMLIIGAAAWAAVTATHLRLRRHRARQTPVQRRTRIVAGQLASLPAVIAGASLLVHAGGGLYWLLAGITLSVLAAVFNAWVLLIEIAR
jgi:hypothetical protein